MYFPYFRGRQYELLALKELVQKKLIGKYIVPVVEPIKISSTFKSTIQAFEKADLKLAMIVNPAVGDFVDSDTTQLMHIKSSSIIPAVIFNESADETFNKMVEEGITKDNVLTILNSSDYVDYFKEIYSNENPAYVLLPDERRMRRAVKEHRVLFEDKFNKQAKNSDYLKYEDEPFSEDHIFFKEENYVGFGDYSIVGNNYEEGGFSPRAVAIHIVYLANDKSLRIRHFVSDSNHDIRDVAGKFYEAVSKLLKWYNDGNQHQETDALATLIDYAQRGYYPGLPTIKKLSIMHHLELVNKCLMVGVDTHEMLH
ncbi:MAG: sce7725 family protein [Oscillospiraceae bacterium]|nr:sce7725 family protein [Oscillospiraceae bacterium]